MPRIISQRPSYLAAFLIVCTLLGSAAFLAIYRGIMPCPLCFLQRITLGFLGIILLIGMLTSSTRGGRLTSWILTLIFAIVGIVLSGRQVWLQHLPPNPSANCDLSLNYMLQALPRHEVAHKLFQGSSECSQVNWQFLYLSLA